MKLKTPSLILVFISLLITNCKTEENKFDYNLIGSWVPVEYSDSLIRVEKTEKLEYNKQGFVFNKDGKLIKRETIQIVDDTAIAFWDFDGSWGRSDSILSLKVERWEGTETSVWKLRPVDSTAFTLLKINDKETD